MAKPDLSPSQVQQELHACIDNFDALHALLQRITPAFVATDAPKWLTDAVAQLAHRLVETGKTHTQWEQAVRAIFRCFQSILSDRDPSPTSRQRIVLRIANILFKLYFRLDQIRLCETISRNVVASGVVFTNYSRADRVAYRYYLGRYHLSQQQFRRSRAHLDWAFRHCSMKHEHNRRLILVYLTVASLPLGLFPGAALLQACSLEPVFGPLVRALIKGDYGGFHRHLREQQQVFDGYGITLFLESRCDMVLYRSLLRRTVLLTLTGTTAQKTPHVQLATLQRAIQFATADELPWDLDDTEHLCVSLIDLGFVKGYVHHERKLLVLDKKTLGFPPLAAVRQIELPGDDDERQFGGS
ncbi:hypothetical protein BCR37DRAFT_194825 [Protomyces lactucae-debilis]|uniref:Uncharacterized protein n=1 Tax=Protomyces lactucae-debilis TaxID=2754530 RepID=A0A1Y2ETB9_PROLT|nr:uncharacterized protein BCR37DRAFT_194825 [Protomyces lactucae-debilis]ORY74803.1 hypothetical protein BCR37DRAFT_194825 [Protomyces lactucae-debilis]